MKHHSSGTREHDEIDKGSEEYNRVDDSIKASENSRNDERTKQIVEEQGTKRIRTERESIRQAKKNRQMPLL